jgi:molybdate transport system substrate-binding protein
MKLYILSGGAAHGLVTALAPAFKKRTGCDIEGAFGAVGAMRGKLLAGAPADVLILTSALIDELVRGGHVVAGSAENVGVVRTGIAVREGDAMPAVTNASELKQILQSASDIYIPDPKLSTAGIHMMIVLEGLQIASEVASRMRAFPNGATAMSALATATGARPVGCTQRTEILGTPGVTYVGALPGAYELATVYTAGLGARAALSWEANVLIALLTGAETASAREKSGFEQVE